MKGLVILGAATAVSADSTINKVVSLLDELKGKVEADVVAETKLMEEYSAWAENEITVTSYAIKDETRIIEEQSGIIEGMSAKVDQHDGEISTLGPAIAGKQTEAKEADAIRTEEHKVFIANEQELVEAEDMLRRAGSVLKNALTNPAFLQQGISASKELVRALGAIVQATWIDENSAAKINAFLEDDDLSLTQQPAQASSYSYESKSGDIVKVIENLREDVVTNLEKARKAELSSRHAFELLSQSLASEIATLSMQLSDSQGNKAAAGEALGNAQGEKKTTDETKVADEDYLSSLKANLAAKEEEWAARQKQANEEIAALEEARDVLSNGVKVFAQTKSTRTRISGDSSEKRDRVVSLLRKLGHKFNSFGLMQAATSASADPFAKVRGLLENLLAKLQEQSHQEADHNEMCVSELAKNEQKKGKKIAGLNKYTTRLDGNVAKTAILKGEIEQLQTQLKELAAAVAQATKMRNAEHAENTQTINDNRDSAAAVQNAIRVLREYYGKLAGESLLQAKTQQPSANFAGGKSDASHSIIAILETAASDFTTLQMETETAEAEAQKAYEKFMQESEVSKAKKEMAIQGKKAELSTLGVVRSQLNDDIVNTNTELSAVVQTLATLHRDCDAKAMSYEERKHRRDSEIAGLQEALEILAPEDAALLQKKGFLQRH